MKKLSFIIYPACLLTLLLVSWGNSTHRVIALIAEKQIGEHTRSSIKELLGSESLADAASWADAAVREEAYKHTASWHFIHLPPGLQNKFELRFVLEAQKDENKEDNIYTAIFKQEAILKDSVSTKSQRAVALKFLISLVADIQDPTHIIIEDKEFYTGRILPRKTNPGLFSYWNDDHLTDQQGKSDADVADAINKTTFESSTRNMANLDVYSCIDWLWESYELNLKISSEIKRNKTSAENYYRDHADVVNECLKVASRRLAGALRSLYPDRGSDIMLPPRPPDTSHYIDAGSKKIKKVDMGGSDAASRVGTLARISNKVYGHKDAGNVVLVYVGAPYPHQFLTLILEGVSRWFETYIDGKKIFVPGEIIKFKGKPAIELDDPYLLYIYDESGKRINLP